MEILAWIILGLIAGAIAKAIYPGHQGGGFLATTALGIIGAIVGGFLGNILLGAGGSALSGSLTISGIIFAILGALLVLFIWGMVTRRSA